MLRRNASYMLEVSECLYTTGRSAGTEENGEFDQTDGFFICKVSSCLAAQAVN